MTKTFNLGALLHPAMQTAPVKSPDGGIIDPTKPNATAVPFVMDFQRQYSLGKGRGKTLISEGVGAQSVSFTVTNTYTVAKVVCLGALVNSMYADATALKTALSADAIINDGIILGSADTTVTVTSNDPGRPIGNFLRYAATSPTRITGARFTSLNILDNSPNSANYDGTISTVFVSPYAAPLIEYFNMRALRSSQDFAKEYAELDFRKAGVMVMVTPENFTTVTVQPGTSLTIVLYTGAQASTAQRMYRDLKAADDLASTSGLF
nr:hypothetical protein [uncultured Fluviicola sp.]